MVAIKLIIAIVILSILVPFIPITSADTINDDGVIVGVINAIIQFNVTNAAHVTYINLSTDGTPDTSPTRVTYRDPTDLWATDYYTGTLHRYMMVFRLEPSTTYYYSINLQGVKGAGTGSFTTLPRFTNETGYGNEFLELSQFKGYSGITLEQSVGVEYPGNPISDYEEMNTEQMQVIYKDGLYYAFTPAHSDSLHLPIGVDPETAWYSTSEDGLYFTDWERISDFRTGEFGVCIDPETGKWIAVQQRRNYGPPYMERIRTADPDDFDTFGTFWNISQNPGYEPWYVYPDPLGANNLVITGLNGYGNRDAIQVYCVPQGTNYSKWILLKTTKQHEDYPQGLGIDGQLPCYYDHYSIVRNQMYVAFVNTLGADISGNTTKYTHLMYSLNGYDWIVFDTTTALIPTGGSVWDCNFIAYAGLVSDENIDRLYYFGAESYHGPYWPFDGAIGLLNFRHKGFTYTNTSSTGYLLTKTISKYFNQNFTVNGDFSEGNTLDISIQYTNGTVMSGFSFEDFDSISTNGTSIEPTWGEKTIEEIPFQDFCLNFSLDGSHGKLYSFDLLGYGEEYEEEPPEEPPEEEPEFPPIDTDTIFDEFQITTLFYIIFAILIVGSIFAKVTRLWR